MARYQFEWECFLEVALLVLAIYMNVTTSYAQSPDTGFLNIDCGRIEDTDVDNIGLSWVSDRTYTRTGINSDPNHSFSINSTFCYDKFGSFGNAEALQDFRYFPENRSKHCYELPSKQNVSYLIRAMFYYSESDVLILPIQFNVSIDGTYWFTVSYSSDTDDPGFIVKEGIFYSPTTVIYFCLQPTIGVPFISSLELRPLDPAMYSYTQSTKYYLSNLIRYNLGSAYTAGTPPVVRYPDDRYDRFWNLNTSWNQYSDINVSSPPQSADANTSANANYVPPKVMRDYYICTGGTCSYPVGFDLNLETPISTVYAALYFQDPNATHWRGSGMTVGLSEEIQSAPFNVTGIPTLKTFANFAVEGNLLVLSLLGRDTIVLNAAEIYEQKRFDFSTTAKLDEEAINALQESFNLTDWQGDPCVPVPYDWLTCAPSISGYCGILHGVCPPAWSVTSITLSYLNGSGFPILITNLTGSPDFKNYNDVFVFDDGGPLQQLTELSITNSAVDNRAFQFLVNNFTSASSLTLTKLDLSYNAIDTILPLVKVNFDLEFPFFSNLSVLNLSHNSFRGELSSFMKTTIFVNTQEIYLDGNHIEGTLNLSSWYDSLTPSASLHHLYSFVNNSITDIYPTAEDFQPRLESLLDSPNFNQTGILLGGNPYCRGAKSLTQRYLCRYTINDRYLFPAKKRNWLIIVAASAGSLAFLACCALFVTLWILRKKVQGFQQIQQALADQKVQPPLYTYSDLKVASRDFHKDNQLGKGAFGVVYKAVLADGTTLAVKKLFNSQKLQVLNEFLNEVVLITGIKHRNLIQLKGCCINDHQRILVYEHAENGNLAEALWGNETRGIMNWKQRYNICLGVARGLSYLHEELQPRIIHRDIKPANILLDRNLNPKIADFGLARQFMEDQSQADYTHLAGTMGYWAPEYAIEGHLSDKADVFSYGTLVLEIVSGRKCIDHSLPPERAVLREWAKTLHKDGMLLELLQPELRQNCDDKEVKRVIEIALICVQLDPKRRATMSQVVTMLSGNIDVTVLLDMHDYNQPDFKVLFPTYNDLHETKIFTIDESDISPLSPLLDKESSTSTTKVLNSISSSSSHVPNIELSAWLGR